MRRRPTLIAFLAVALLALVVAAVLGAREQRTLAFTLGVPSFGTVATLAPGQQVCQEPIPPGDAFDAIDLQAGTPNRPVGPLAVTVVRADGRTPLGHGTLPAAAAGGQLRTVTVGRVDTQDAIAVCIRNAGRRSVAVGDGPDLSARTSSAQLDGRPIGADIQLVFRRHEARSTLALLPQALDRAALFRAGWIGPWLYWLLLAAVAIVVPALLARSLARAASSDSEPPGAD